MKTNESSCNREKRDESIKKGKTRRESVKNETQDFKTDERPLKREGRDKMAFKS